MKNFLSLPSRFIRGFYLDDCYLWASGLSYYTLLSIVPLLAIVFGIAKGFGFEQALEKQILELFYQQIEFALKVIQFAKSALETAHTSLITGIGVFFLFWTSIGLLGNFERALNKIWNVSNPRSFKEQVTAYLPLLVFGPIAVVGSSSLTFVIISEIVELSTEQGIYPDIKPAIEGAYYVVLILISWILFLFLYTYIPNKRIPLRSCLIASLITSIAFQVSQWAYIHLQIYLTSYNAIYGSFAAIPLFLIWLQASWMIILGGAELAKQIATIKKELVMPLSERGLFLLVILHCCKAYLNQKPFYTSQSLADTLSLDVFTSEKVLNRLCDTHLLIQTADGEFIPAFPPDQIMIDQVFAAVDNPKDSLFHVNDSLERDRVQNLLNQWDKEQKSLPSNTSLKNIL